MFESYSTMKRFLIRVTVLLPFQRKMKRSICRIQMNRLCSAVNLRALDGFTGHFLFVQNTEFGISYWTELWLSGGQPNVRDDSSHAHCSLHIDSRFLSKPPAKLLLLHASPRNSLVCIFTANDFSSRPRDIVNRY